MSRFITFSLFALLLTIPAFAFEWSGRLVDADCTHKNGGLQACDPGLNTTSFGLVVAGKPYLFDWKGSQKAALAIKHRAEAGAASNKRLSPTVNASITGERLGAHKILVKTVTIEPVP